MLFFFCPVIDTQLVQLNLYHHHTEKRRKKNPHPVSLCGLIFKPSFRALAGAHKMWTGRSERASAASKPMAAAAAAASGQIYVRRNIKAPSASRVRFCRYSAHVSRIRSKTAEVPFLGRGVSLITCLAQIPIVAPPRCCITAT